jgi:ribose transport system substrate-binding protein
VSEHDVHPEDGSGLDRASLLKVGGIGALAVAGMGAFGAKAAHGAGMFVSARGGGDYSGLRGKTVGVIGVAVTSEAPARAAAHARKVAAANGFKVEVVDTAGDYGKMSATMEAWARSKRVTAIVSDVVAPSLVKAGMKAANDAGIPVGGVFAGFEPGLAFDVASNEWVSTARIGTYVADRLGGEGAVAFLNWPNVPALRQRQAAIEGILGYYDGIKIVDKQVLKVPGQVPDAKTKTRALLQKYRKGQLHAIWAGWDEPGVAASQAVKQAGRKDVFVVGIDGNLASFDAIRRGDPFAATCGNDMEGITEVCLQQLSSMLKGGKPKANTFWVDAPFIARQNVPAQGKFPRGAGLTTYYER